ncbi:MAG: pyruvate dehydrogenase (acetyl-transferring) E1 component subunit alpha [Armatimonadetes bacterium RBG_16_58_9]|nr:MAG: pyruvate dehydrogenase (acetyl-transferring) E1 component subunit alpha [Armatimonadetes bacterium RBG_16_58_9]
MMLRIRAFEERVHKIYLDGEMMGMSPHLSCGEEAMAAGVSAALRPDDYVLTTHRGHGHVLARGTDTKKMMAELCGKVTGTNKGRGGTLHIADCSLNVLGANGIVGGGLPIACGVGYSIKYRGTDQVCVIFFGDAASNQGTFHESVNLAAAFKLPIVYVCENNLYGLSTPYANVSATPDVADRAKGYNIPGVIVQGWEVNKVHEAAVAAVERARAGEGPSLIEGKTYRYYGHSASDHRPYRTREEEEEWKCERDPICTLRAKMTSSGEISEDQYNKMEAEALAEAEECWKFASESPFPDPSTVMDYVYG